MDIFSAPYSMQYFNAFFLALFRYGLLYNICPGKKDVSKYEHMEYFKI